MTGTKNQRTSENGVSESIGFLLIFTLIMVGIGLVTLYGYPMLLQQQTSADEQIMEKNMIVLQNDFKSLAYKTVPFKETSLKVGGGTLTVYNLSEAGPTFRVYPDIVYDPSTAYMPANKTGDLRYESADAQTQISLQNGAVLKQSTTGTAGSVMLAQPRWFYDAPTKTLVINLVCVNSTYKLSKAGIGTIQMALGETSYTYLPGLTPDISVDVETDPGQDPTGWDTYLRNSMGMTCDAPSGSVATGETITCHFYQAATPVNTLVIKRTEIIIQSL
jgi:hypothetical protein